MELQKVIPGYIDFYGHFSIASGWMLCGWVAQGWLTTRAPTDVTISFEHGEVSGENLATLYRRHDLAEGAEGVIFYVQSLEPSLGRLLSCSFTVAGVKTKLFPTKMATRLRELELLSRLRGLLADARHGASRDEILALLTRQPYTGEDTISSLNTSILLAIDEAIQCGPDGVVLMGWILFHPGAIRSIRLRCGALSTPIPLPQSLRVDRPDVLAAYPNHGFTDSRCGFVAYLRGSFYPNEKLYIEIESIQRRVAYFNVRAPRLAGMAAIRRLLDAIDIRYGDVKPAFDNVIGPAVETINSTRLEVRPAVTLLQYGNIPANPKFSIIVPLFGRLDYVEYQLAFFSAHPPAADFEMIYVLDDPPKRRQAQSLFASAFERFRIPFKALLLDCNVGFAPANNIGLAHAHGDFVAYLNSDVFPDTHDWMEQLAGRLVADPTLGAVGPLLLFEDGSIQHCGIYFEPLAEFGDWLFCQHHDKALRISGEHDLQERLVITGACMVLRREIANKMGGFDEVFAIGDFEDSDLCLKLRAIGLRCAVDYRVRLFHLERKSQARPAAGWRLNLTLYNAWQHERRWRDVIVGTQQVHWRKLNDTSQVEGAGTDKMGVVFEAIPSATISQV